MKKIAFIVACLCIQSIAGFPVQAQSSTPNSATTPAPIVTASTTTTVTPNDGHYQKLSQLIQRYGLVATLENRSLTRYEFAVVVNVVVDQLNEKMAKGEAIDPADLQLLKELQTRFAPELATLRGRVDGLEAKTAKLEKQQFSTTTRLHGESVFIGQDQLLTRFGGASGGVRSTFLFAEPSRPEPEPSQRLSTEDYNRINETPFQRPTQVPLSTFSIDVDTASYSNTRRFIQNGQLPPKDAVRIEELINYFPYSDPGPTGNQPFSVNTELTQTPWNPQHKLVRIGLKGKIPSIDRPSNLTFLVDVSGSMNSPNKLPLVQQSLKLMVSQLSQRDRVSLVVYAGNAGLVLPPTSVRDKQKIDAAIDRLQAGGSTAGGEGIELAYKTAQQNFLKDGNNRVVLATDGDFNVGMSSDADLERLIESKRDQGIFLTVLGFGIGNYKDNKMETLADKGNGNYAYIDNLLEAKKVLGHDLRGTLFTIAKDVKIQVEFNPTKVQAYRLIGYENRALRDQDFNDDKKDAGDIGAGHSVTALYEIIPMGIDSRVKLPKIDDLKYQKPKEGNTSYNADELMQVKLRYKEPNADTSQLITTIVNDRPIAFDATSENLKFSAAVAMYGFLLRDSEYKGMANFDRVLTLAKQSQGRDEFGYRGEFIQLVRLTQTLAAGKGDR